MFNDGEVSYKNEQDYKDKERSRAELAEHWSREINAANVVYQKWADRFKVNVLYQYYEGFQWDTSGTDTIPYVVNLIYSTIETKLPNLIFQNPQYALKPRPSGVEYDFETASKSVQTKEDILNYVVRRKEFGLSDIHELAALDAFFGFGVIHIGYSNDPSENPSVSLGDPKNALNNLFCKQIPFDTFRVAATANWNLSKGKWWGYYEYVPNERLKAYSKKGLTIDFDKPNYPSGDQINTTGKINTSEFDDNEIPEGHIKIWNIWDFDQTKYIKFCPGNASLGDRLLDYETFTTCGISTLRYGKRRRGWYPLPPVFNWISPQDEVNDIRQTFKIHRKRYSRKYGILENGIEPEEMDKFLYGPDGTVIKLNRPDALVPIKDEPLDTSNQQSLVVSYDDFLRVSGSSSEQGRIGDRTTATQANINNRLSQIRESKDLQVVGLFMAAVGQSILRSLREAKEPFWAEISLHNEVLMGEIKEMRSAWKRIPPQLFEEEDYEVDTKLSSISPVYQQEDKKSFMEFLALITQYEILSFSPAALREAAYRCGYKNEQMLNQFMQLAQLAALGRQLQLKQQVQQISAPQPTQPGQLAQNQTENSTPPDNEEIMNQIFNRQGVQ